jgi:hypothetical protein
MDVFWVVVPCSLVEEYQRFRGRCFLHHQGDERWSLSDDISWAMKSSLVISYISSELQSNILGTVSTSIIINTVINFNMIF